MDINTLRKSGRLNEAYAMAVEELQLNPDNIWAKRAMGWVLYDYAKQNTAIERHSQFIRCVDQIVLLALPPVEELFYKCLGILIRNVVRKVVDAKQPADDFLDALFESIKQLPSNPPSEFHSGLLQTLLKTKLQWSRFGEFVEWWNIDNLRKEDFVGLELAEGKKDFPLSEKVFMAYSKWLLGNINAHRKRIEEWIPKLESLTKKYPKYVYLPYYLAKLWLNIGENAKAVAAIKPFLKQKSSEFWVWELLGDAEQDKDRKFAFYSKAMLCKSKEEMLVSLREKMALMLSERGLYAEAKCEIQKVVELRQRHQWKVSVNLQNMIDSEHFNNVESIKSNKALYEQISAKVAEEMGIRSGKRKDCNRQDRRIGNRPTEEATLGHKMFTGKMRKNGAGFGFVGEVFVPVRLAEKFESGNVVRGKAKRSFDEKKQQWGWKAVELQSVE